MTRKEILLENIDGFWLTIFADNNDYYRLDMSLKRVLIDDLKLASAIIKGETSGDEETPVRKQA